MVSTIDLRNSLDALRLEFGQVFKPAPVPVRLEERALLSCDGIEFRVIAYDGLRLGAAIFTVSNLDAIARSSRHYLDMIFSRLAVAREAALQQYLVDCGVRGDWPELQVLIDLVHETGVEVLMGVDAC